MCKHCKNAQALSNTSLCRGCWQGWWTATLIHAALRKDHGSSPGGAA